VVGPVWVIAPATHDTASAVVGTPLQRGWAYISSGTWSLVGVERMEPLLSDVAAAANFTNEAGAGGTIRFLKNVMGLWVLDACRREWRAMGIDATLDSLLTRVGSFSGRLRSLNLDDPRFFNPANMLDEIGRAFADRGDRAPGDPVALTKVILDSLALRYASVVRTIEALTGRGIEGIHIVGGGSQNSYLNQATADASGRPVLAGPVEATAAGNILVQALSDGDVSSIEEGRAAIARSTAPLRFDPRRSAEWADAVKRFEELATP